jgi:hypothetical protein
LTCSPFRKKEATYPLYIQELYFDFTGRVKRTPSTSGKLFKTSAIQLDTLMQTLHQIEQDKRSLDHYVTALFIVTLSLGYWAVNTLDAYLQSVQ